MGRLWWALIAQEKRRGELWLFFFALMISVGAMSCVDFLSRRLNDALEKEAHQFLAGDLLLSSDKPWAEIFNQEATARGLRLTESVTFGSMARASDRTELSLVKAVGPLYPLRGALKSDGANPATTPAAGTVWVDDALASRLQVSKGDIINLGESSFRVTAILLADPERPSGFSGLLPKLLMSVDDLAATKLIQPGSRARYRLHVAGDEAAVDSFRQWASERLERGARIESLRDSHEDVGQVLEQGQRYLRLISLLTAILAVVVCVMGCRSYALRHSYDGAILRCLGARSRQVLAVHCLLFIAVGMAAALAGLLLGFLTQSVLAHNLATFAHLPLPPLRWSEGVRSVVSSTLLLSAFVVPPLLRLSTVPVIGVLRSNENSVKQTFNDYLPGVIVAVAMTMWLAGEWKLGLMAAAGFSVFVALIAVLAWLLLRLSVAVVPRGRWHLALRNLLRRPGALVQVVALTLGLTTLLLLNIVSVGFLRSWLGSLPETAPNFFVVNIQPNQLKPLEETFRQNAIPLPKMDPMIRGRLIAINGTQVRAEDYREQRTRALVEREFNLSWGQDIPPENTIVAGQWFTNQQIQFSVEQGIAERLKLKIGDTLEFNVLGENYQGAITSLRKLAWNSLRVNFFVIMPPGILPVDFASYLTSFYLPPEKTKFVNELIKDYPNLTVIDVRQILTQIQSMLSKLTAVIQGLLLFALVAGVGVVAAGLHSQSRVRAQEVALWRVMGERRRQVLGRLATEFAILGALAGSLAMLGSTLMAALLARYVLDIPYTPSLYQLWGPIVGIVLCLVSGLWGSRPQLKGIPLEILGR